MLEATTRYIKKNTGIVIPASLLGVACLMLIGWTYRHDTRLTIVEIRQENLKEKIDSMASKLNDIHKLLIKSE